MRVAQYLVCLGPIHYTDIYCKYQQSCSGKHSHTFQNQDASRRAKVNVGLERKGRQPDGWESIVDIVSPAMGLFDSIKHRQASRVLMRFIFD